MQQEAEQFAEEDKIKRESAEVRNTADSTLWRVESTLEEHDDKIDDELKEEIKTAMTELKDVMDSNEPDTIKEKTDALLAAERKVGDKIYAQSSQQSSSDDDKKDDDETVDAEYE